MNINRHNYEECFILYMDNELSIEERRQVEEFMKKNPDLKEELEILTQYKLEPDTSIVFNGKEELMKLAGESPVSLSDYEGWLVLYMDNELTDAQRASVDRFIAEHPSIQKELDLLRLTQLQPEEIVFANKSSLYRKEDKVRPILPAWWRMAAAAVLVIALSIGSVIVFNKKSNSADPKLAKTRTTPPTGQKTTNTVTVKENKEIAAPEIANNNKQKVVEQIKQGVTVNQGTIAKRDNKNNQPIEKKNIAPNNDEPQKDILADNNRKSNDLAQPIYNPNVNPSTTSNVQSSVAKNINNNPPSKEFAVPNRSLTTDDVTSKTSQPSYTSNATSNDDVDFNQSSGKKNKLRGFFRKVTRTFEKNTNISATDDDNRLLIGSLAIKIK